MTHKPVWIKLCELVMAVMLGLMVVLVFGNVVLRYGFNSGIVMSEELSRFLFVWLTFIGAIVAMRENTHLGVDSLVRMVGRKSKQWLYAISSLLMLACCAILFWGSYKQTVINLKTPSAVLEIPMATLYGIGMVAAAGIAVIIAGNLWRLLTGKLADNELVQTADSEEVTDHSEAPAAVATPANTPVKA